MEATTPMMDAKPEDTDAAKREDQAESSFADTARSAQSSHDSPPPPSDTGVEASEKPFKYKYAEAAPTPPGLKDVDWNKIYTAADSRMYNKHGKSSTNSKKYRVSGETYQLALNMQREKEAKEAAKAKEAAAKEAAGSKDPSSKQSTPKPVAAAKATQPRGETPGSEKVAMTISEHIKNEGRSRKAVSAAPSSNRGTPAPSISESVPKMSPSKPAKSLKRKKGNKRVPKNGARPNTPSIKRDSQTPGPRSAQDDEDDSGSDDGREYCLCRGPDDHRLMVYCEGGCEDWYHCECVKVDVLDAKQLLDRFICPKCRTEEKFTTFKPMCRMFNVNKCRKAARISADPPSKYCSDEHSDEFAIWVKQNMLRQDDTPSMGGKLNVYEAAAMVSGVKSKAELDALGQKPKLPRKEGDDQTGPTGLDYLTAEEKKTIEKYTARQKDLTAEVDGLKLQTQLLNLIVERAKIANGHSNFNGKAICGYDERLSFNPEQFDEWKETMEGKTALETKVLGPRTEETKHIDEVVPLPGEINDPDTNLPDELKSLCTNQNPKKCRHSGWQEMHRNDYASDARNAINERLKLQHKINGIIQDAETREATKDHDAHNETIQFF